MADLIDRQAAINAIHDWENSYRWDDSQFFDVDDVVAPGDVIRELPSAEPERKPGRWLMHSDFPDRLICSECGAQFDVWHWESEQMHFCPNCGAKMDGGKSDE